LTDGIFAEPYLLLFVLKSLNISWHENLFFGIQVMDFQKKTRNEYTSGLLYFDYFLSLLTYLRMALFVGGF
jgi:hypothetical protein